MINPGFTNGIMASACNIRCFFNEHAAKSFTSGWLLIMISSSDMAPFHPYVIHRGGFVKLKRHHRPFLFIAKLWHSGRWCHACVCECMCTRGQGYTGLFSSERGLLHVHIHCWSMGQHYWAQSLIRKELQLWGEINWEIKPWETVEKKTRVTSCSGRDGIRLIAEGKFI